MPLRLTAPSSKSMTQRALLIAALSEASTVVARPLDCDDSRHLARLLRALGVEAHWQSDGIEVVPGPLVGSPDPIYCGNAGTAVRFGACLSLLTDGGFVIDGDEHMRQRPIVALGDALHDMGVAVSYPQRHGCPPIALERQRAAPTRVCIDATLSSQYASGLLMVAPRLPGGLTLTRMGAAVSRPYLDMTVAMMRRSGAQIRELADGWEVAPVRYTGCERIEVEPDWSGAAFLLACAKVGGFDLEVEGLARESLQGDRAFVEMMQTQWTPSDEPLVVDLTDTPDLIAPLAAMAPFAPRPTHLRGAAHARVKECDRVKVLSEQLARAGVITREHQDGLDIQPLTQLPTASITLDPHDDHRMAMAFGVLSLRMPHIEVRNMACVSKSFPEFWDVLAQIREWIAAC